MSPEIDLLSTYPVCGHERTDTMLFHIEIQKDCQDRDVAVEVYDVATDVRIAMAVARLTKERTPDVTPQVDMRQTADAVRPGRPRGQ
jgi:hypothetical protein